MSKYDEYENMYYEIDEPHNNTKSFDLGDLDPDGELTRQLAAIRKKDRIKMLIAGFAAGLMLTIGVGYYVADAGANSDTSGYQTDAGAGYGASFAGGSYGGSNQYAIGGSAGGGGGGCGSGGCGGGSGALGSASLPDLEKQALAEYTKETGAKDVTAKATDFGCHIQMDISDKTGKIVRSYGYQGGALYVIK